MAKEVMALVKLHCPAGQATPAPPIGPALGAHGANISEFVKQFNDKTRDQVGMTIPVEISIYKDRSFDFIMKSPPASVLLLKAAGVEKGAVVVGTDIVGSVTRAQLEEIVELKKEDLNARDVDHAVRIIAGTARSMGILVSEDGLPAPAASAADDASEEAPAGDAAPAEETPAEETPAEETPAEEAPEGVKD
jgi:large subunit ribosomal protein L11